ncbi:YgfZ/GcvT domain-containing protein [Kaustia mangrovi]|uniref:CAF17-like 4Fe-4S cluster assembly/insertion protein YgfZ n=1 Tax=Kaustia mangrovi TaxID=2593653 RepID=UPI003CCD25F7
MGRRRTARPRRRGRRARPVCLRRPQDARGRPPGRRAARLARPACRPLRRGAGRRVVLRPPPHRARSRRQRCRYRLGPHLPHEANLDQFGGVDFTKGCYVGQEVVSRMQHRGTARKRILPVRFDGAPPAEGAEIVADGKSLGTMLSGVEGMGLALLRLDRMEVAFADGAALSADGKALVPMRPGWARFPVPGTGVDA